MAYLAAVCALELVRVVGPGLDPERFASSPAEVAEGHLLQLFSSGLVVSGTPLPQLVGLVLAGAFVLLRLGPGAFWRAALAGHVLATLLVYAGVGLLWLGDQMLADEVAFVPDYGISCVWAGLVGALVGAATRGPEHRHARSLERACVVVLVAAIPLSPGLAGIEHVVAFLLGGACVAPPRRSGARRAQPLAHAGAARG